MLMVKPRRTSKHQACVESHVDACQEQLTDKHGLQIHVGAGVGAATSYKRQATNDKRQPTSDKSDEQFRNPPPANGGGFGAPQNRGS